MGQTDRLKNGRTDGRIAALLNASTVQLPPSPEEHPPTCGMVLLKMFYCANVQCTGEMQRRVTQPTCRLYLGTGIHQPVVVVVARQPEAVLHHHPTTVIPADKYLMT